MRVGIVALQHESNTFSPLPTTLDDFTVAEGEAVVQAWRGSHHEVAGYLDGLQEEGLQPVPILTAVATPGGSILADAATVLLDRLVEGLRGAGPLDGILAAAHGAAVSEGHPDLDGHWLSAVRDQVGRDTPVICTVDAHANLSHRMAEACDAIIAYRTNPHLDTHERGLEAARLMARTLRGAAHPTQAAAFPPVVINILHQNTARPPFLPLAGLVGAVRHREGVLSVSACLGFPYADVRDMGASFVVVTDARPAVARACADELARALVERRKEFVPDLLSPEDAVERAAAAPGPVLLLDTGDNVGGGSPGDGTALAHAVAARRGPRTFVALHDPESAARAWAAGPGGRAHLAMGGKSDPRLGPPLEAAVTVRSLHDGRFTEPEVRHGGITTYDMGRTAVVETEGGLTVQLTSRRTPPFSLHQLRRSGVDPRAFHILVVKGVHAPLPAYEPVCSTVIWASTPGPTTPDLSRLDFRHRRRPLFPFEEIPGADRHR